MKEITFTYNWNNKLNCRCFTSIRLSEEYKTGEVYKVILKKGKDKTALGVSEIIEIKEFYLDNLNKFIAALDTGYSVEECKKIILRMYPGVDFTKTKLRLLLFKYIQ